MKTGTTSLQRTLYANRTRLADAGILVPGARWGIQVDAVLDVLGKAAHPTGRPVRGAWDRLVAETRAWPGTAVISVELLAPAGPAQIERIAASFADARLDVVLSLRDLNRTVPAMWQETVQNGRSWTWDDYVAGVERGRPRPRRRDDEISPASHSFWRQQAGVRLVRHWRTAGTVHLVTVPRPGSPTSLLLERFGAVVGFDASALEAPEPVNTSLGAASTEVLRRMNSELDARGLTFPAGIRIRKRLFAKQVLPALARDERRIGVPVMPWTEEHAAGMVAGLQELAPPLYGEWADLRPSPVPGITASDVTIEEVAAAAATGYRALHAALSIPDRHTGILDADGIPEWEPGAASPEQVARDGAVALADLVTWAVRATAPRVGA